MKWPFFKSAPPETKSNPKPLVRPPRPPAASGATYCLKKTQVVNDAPPPVTVGDRTTIAVPLNTIADQLPPTIYTPTVAERLEGYNLEIPTESILPQLPKGRVTMSLGDVFNLFPPDARPINLINTVRQQEVTLPIDLIVSLIPSDAFQTRANAIEDVDDAELEQLPALFDDSFLNDNANVSPAAATADSATTQEQETEDEAFEDDDIFSEKSDHSLGETQRIAFPGLPSEPAKAVAKPAPTPTPAVPPAPAPQAPAPAPAPVATPSPSLPAGVPAEVEVALRSLVSNMPAELFATPAPAVWETVDPQQPIKLPVAEILPKLASGRVTLPLATVAKAMPASLLVGPLPDSSEVVVPLPLSEIISQLPPSVFMPAAATPGEDEMFTEDEDLSLVFHERSAPPPLPEPPEVQPMPAETQAEAPVEPEPVVEETVSAPEPVAEMEAPALIEQQEPAESPALEPTQAVAPEPTAEPAVEPPAMAVEIPETPAAQPTPATTPAGADQSSGFDIGKFLINVNTCSLEDLTNINGIGPAMAKRIIEHRERRGQFTNIEQLREIPGIGRKTFRALAGASPSALNRALGVDHNHELTLQEVIQLTGTLRGIEGCILTSSDGLFLTGHLPPHLDENRLSVFAPQLFKKVGRYARELSVGQVHRMTMFTDQQPVSIFQAGDIYLIVIHDTQHFSKALLRRLTRISEGIARLCRQRAVV